MSDQEKRQFKVLVVDDNEDDSFLLVQQLKKSQLHPFVTVVSDGKEALDYLLGQLTPPSVIFLDLFLPGIKGTEVLRRIKQVEYLVDVPVVIISGTLNPKDREECESLGIRAFLSKSEGYDAAVNIVAHLLLNERLAASEWG